MKFGICRHSSLDKHCELKAASEMSLLQGWIDVGVRRCLVQICGGGLGKADGVARR